MCRILVAWHFDHVTHSDSDQRPGTSGPSPTAGRAAHGVGGVRAGASSGTWHRRRRVRRRYRQASAEALRLRAEALFAEGRGGPPGRVAGAPSLRPVRRTASVPSPPDPGEWVPPVRPPLPPWAGTVSSRPPRWARRVPMPMRRRRRGRGRCGAGGVHGGAGRSGGRGGEGVLVAGAGWACRAGADAAVVADAVRARAAGAWSLWSWSWSRRRASPCSTSGPARTQPVRAPEVVRAVAPGGGGGQSTPVRSRTPGRRHAAACRGARLPAVRMAASAGTVIVVDVSGKVRSPGIHRLPAGSRVADALRAAGGVRPGADTEGLNRARLLVDGEQVVVGAPAAPGGTGSGAVGGFCRDRAGTGAAAAAAAPIGLNTATAEQLDTPAGRRPRARPAHHRLPHPARRLPLGRRTPRGQRNRRPPVRRSAESRTAMSERGELHRPRAPGRSG